MYVDLEGGLANYVSYMLALEELHIGQEHQI